MERRHRPTKEPELIPKKPAPVDKPYKADVSWFWRAWFWLSGKKTIIGLAALKAGDLTESWLSVILTIIGLILTPVGALHKAGKELNKRTSGDKINWNEIANKIWEWLKGLFSKWFKRKDRS